ncbi:type II toxin-antitoxin system VapC family toxin [Nocardia sp. NPDC049707]|uniref:type II toxin-antitoxin system VapC family toxin n=1 Tax=Nocardia sp. NPDC049707 TaxID=3154735 RepID=UPI003432BEDB
MAVSERMSMGLLDTSVFIARESGRRIDIDLLPEESAVSVVTFAELRWGVLMSVDDESRSRRLDTLMAAQRLQPIPIDERVVAAWALLRQRLKAAGTKMEINDSWIAATAMAHGWPVATQDTGFSSVVPELTVIQV